MNQSTKVRGNMHSNRKEHKYIFITECDLILHKYYITKRRKRHDMQYKMTGRFSRATKWKSRESDKRRQTESDLHLIHHASIAQRISTEGSTYPSSEIWICKCRDCQKATQWVLKMKSSGVHMESHIQDHSDVTQSCKYKPVNTKIRKFNTVAQTTIRGWSIVSSKGRV